MIFENVFAVNAFADNDPACIRISIDTKATVHVGEFSRGGKSRALAPVKGMDHDMSVKKKMIPVGILEPQSGASFIAFGDSNKTSDLIADGIKAWYDMKIGSLAAAGIKRIVINSDNGPECNSHRSQFMARMVDFVDATSMEIRMVYYPPYHSKYNPIEHFWGGLERSWNGYLLDSVETVLKRAAGFAWGNTKTVVKTLFGEYQKGITLDKMRKVALEGRLMRSDSLPKWDVKIIPKR